MTFSKMTLSIITNSTMTLSIKAPSIMTLRKITLSIMAQHIKTCLQLNDTQQNDY